MHIQSGFKCELMRYLCCDIMITNNEILNLALVIRLINPAFGPRKKYYAWYYISDIYFRLCRGNLSRLSNHVPSLGCPSSMLMYSLIHSKFNFWVNYPNRDLQIAFVNKQNLRPYSLHNTVSSLTVPLMILVQVGWRVQ